MAPRLTLCLLLALVATSGLVAAEGDLAGASGRREGAASAEARARGSRRRRRCKGWERAAALGTVPPVSLTCRLFRVWLGSLRHPSMTTPHVHHAGRRLQQASDAQPEAPAMPMPAAAARGAAAAPVPEASEGVLCSLAGCFPAFSAAEASERSMGRVEGGGKRAELCSALQPCSPSRAIAASSLAKPEASSLAPAFEHARRLVREHTVFALLSPRRAKAHHDATHAVALRLGFADRPRASPRGVCLRCCALPRG